MTQIKEDRIISEFLRSLGPWREHIVVVGGYALFIYKLYLSKGKTGAFPIGTRDIDSLIPRKVPKQSEQNIAEHLLRSGFTCHFTNTDIPPGESYTKKIEEEEIEIEFLTDTSSRLDKNEVVTIQGVSAQPLKYLELSLKNTIKFRTLSNETGYVVVPGAWIFHKGLTFIKRKNKSKNLKDLYGIWYVSNQLENDFSEQAILEMRSLGIRHPKWFRLFKKNLLSWVEDATPSLWEELEMQDPSGKLKKMRFLRAIERLTE